MYARSVAGLLRNKLFARLIASTLVFLFIFPAQLVVAQTDGPESVITTTNTDNTSPAPLDNDVSLELSPVTRGSFDDVGRISETLGDSAKPVKGTKETNGNNEEEMPVPRGSLNGVAKNIDTTTHSLNIPKTDATGALVYTYPLVLPPGRNGLTPQLNLVYNSNSQNNDSALGFGWELDVPSVTRVNRHGSDQLYNYNDFTSSLSGELVQVGSSTSYLAKVDDGEFLNYQFANNVWTVYDSRGIRYLFGSTSAARMDDAATTTRVYRWMLEEVRDTNDNFIRYEYYKNNGQVYPDRIIYTGHGVIDGPFTATFNRSAFDMGPTMYYPDFAVKTDYRISGVDLKVNNDWARKYEFGIATSTAHRLLSSITESGRDLEASTTVTQQPVIFNYQAAGPISWTSTDAGAWQLPTWLYSKQTGLPTLIQVRDLNGDAYPDALFYKYRSSGEPACPDDNETWFNDTHGGWTENCSTSWRSPEVISNNGAYYTSDNGVRTFDINGDQMTDLVQSGTTETHATSTMVTGYKYLNIANDDGTWSAQSSVSLPPFIYDTALYGDRSDNGVEPVDVNGDGLTDLVHGYVENPTLPYYVERAYLGNGSGWTAEDSNWNLPWGLVDENIGHGHAFTFAQFTDLNGDGLTDFVFRHENGAVGNKVGINNGHDWLAASTTIPMATMSSTHLNSGQSDEGVRTMDLNGDGVLDLLRLKTVGGSMSTWGYLNRLVEGNSFVEASIGTVTKAFANGDTDETLSTMAVDMNADGLDDVVYYEQNANGSVSKDTQLATGTPFTDLLSRVTSSDGAATTISYKMSTQYFDDSNDLLNPHLPLAIKTVNTISTHDGIRGHATSTSAYTYADGSYYFNNSYDRKFAGFGLITESDPEGNITKTYYHQGNETATSSGEYDDHISKMGKPYRVEKYDDDDNLYAKTINKWDRYDRGNGSSFVKLAQSTEFSYDGDGDHREKAESFAYDDSTGNLSQKIEWGEVSGSNNGSFSDTGGDKFTTNLSYATSTATSTMAYWPSVETTVDQSGSKVRETRHYYDTLALGSANKGNETKTEQWIASSNYIDTEKTYNSYGLVTEEKDPRDKITTYTYDAYNLYPATTTNPLSQTVQRYYDYSSGKPKEVIDANGYHFQTIYDGLDRVIEEKQPDLTTPSTLVTKTTYSYATTSLPRVIHRTDYLGDATSTDSYTYLDGFARVIQEKREAEDGNWTTRDRSYDYRGLLASETLPYFTSTASSTSATSTDALYTSYAYDALRRMVSIDNILGETDNEYDQWRLTVTDPNSKVKDLYSDAYQNLVQVDEHNGTSTYSTYYEWDGNKNLSKITDALGNVRNFSYDGLGRRLTAQDLHAVGDSNYGTWYYAYDAAGNVASSTDPKSQNVVYSYDDLNRPLTENYTGASGTEITYTYDVCGGGVGRLCNATSTGAGIAYQYNPLGSIKGETKQIAGTTYTLGYTYDRQGNLLTITYPDTSVVRHDYNSAGQEEALYYQQAGGSFVPVVSDLDYSPLGQKTFIQFANSASTTNTYDPAALYRLSNKVTKHDTTKFQDLAYTYDAVGNITGIIDSSNTNSAKNLTYQYDDLYRLTRASSTAAVYGSNYLQTYSYNALGNLTNKSDVGSYTYSTTTFANPHAATSIAGNAVTYDPNGNLLTFTNNTHTWDYRNRLATTTIATKTGPSATTTYTYDHTDARVSYRSGATSTITVAPTYELANGCVERHLYAGEELVATIKDTLCLFTGFGLDGEGEFYPYSIHYVHTDHLGGTAVVTDSSAVQEELVDYYPFGSPRLDQPSAYFTERNKYIGQDYDQETGLNYLNARYQNGARGLFLSQDPVFLSVGDEQKLKEKTQRSLEDYLSDPQGLNSYSYAKNNPLVFKDSSGKYIEIGVSGTYLGWSGAAGVRISTKGVNVFAAGGAGVGASGHPVSVSYTPGDIPHTSESVISVGGSYASGIGGGLQVNGKYQSETVSLSEKSYQPSIVLGAGADVYVRKEVSVPIIGGKAPEGLILDPNPSPNSTPNYIPAPPKDDTQYISRPNSTTNRPVSSGSKQFQFGSPKNSWKWRQH